MEVMPRSSDYPARRSSTPNQVRCWPTNVSCLPNFLQSCSVVLFTLQTISVCY